MHGELGFGMRSHLRSAELRGRRAIAVVAGRALQNRLRGRRMIGGGHAWHFGAVLLAPRSGGMRRFSSTMRWSRRREALAFVIRRFWQRGSAYRYVSGEVQ